ncbi:MAG: hypothetical protein OXI96_02090 [Acidimicrobiaceae bacterium]|nr:hypothetical protein [Acidimicrobiaceae bacterium]
MVYLAIPALAATSIVSEHRRQTLTLVQLSLLRPFDIVWAKVTAPITPILVPAGISMLTWSLFLLQHGGFSVAGVGAVCMFTLVMCSVFIVSAVSVLISTLVKSSAPAITLSYAVLVVLFWLLSLLVIYLLVVTGRFLDQYSLFHPLLINNIPRPVLFTALVAYSFVFVVVSACVVGGFVWWACRRLRLPAKRLPAKKGFSAHIRDSRYKRLAYNWKEHTSYHR